LKDAEQIRLEVPAELDGQRLDLVLSQLMNSDAGAATAYSRSKLAKYIEQGFVTVDDVLITKSSYRIEADSEIIVQLPLAVPQLLIADESIKINYIAEDDAIAVIDKPAGLVVHPGAGNESGTLVHGLLAKFGASFSGVGHPMRPGIVHRLDKDTSGLMVVAKTLTAYNHLIQQFLPPRTVSRTYYALTFKTPQGGTTEGVIDLPIARHPADRKKMSTSTNRGKEAISHWRLIEELKWGTLLKIKLETGRTHQIRVHLQAKGAGIIGDQVYPAQAPNLPPILRKKITEFGRQALHAKELSFIHPLTLKEFRAESNLPADFQSLLSSMGES